MTKTQSKLAIRKEALAEVKRQYGEKYLREECSAAEIRESIQDQIWDWLEEEQADEGMIDYDEADRMAHQSELIENHQNEF